MSELRRAIAYGAVLLAGLIGASAAPVWAGVPDDSAEPTASVPSTDPDVSPDTTTVASSTPGDDVDDADPEATPGGSAEDGTDVGVTAAAIIGASLLVLVAIMWMLRVNRPPDH